MTDGFKKTRLYCPGPTPVGLEASVALLNTNVYHRTADFCERVMTVRRGLSPFFGTSELPLILAASGTGAMEAAMANLTNEGDEVIVLVAGKFGERWQKMAQAFKCEVQTVACSAGDIPAIDALLAKLKATPTCKAIFLQANETSTGVQLPVEQICKQVRATGYTGLIIVDAISALCAHKIQMDAWQIDCVVSGSQKGFGIPPGLAFIALAQLAWGKLSRRPRFYFDLERERKNQDDGNTAFTPATGLILALEASLKIMHNFGVEEIFQHHETLAIACRAACKAVGLSLFAKDHPSNAVTAITLPVGLDGQKLLSSIRKTDAAIFAGGQDELKGKIIRMSHLGFVDRLDLIAGVAALEFGLQNMGHKFVLGSGVSAAMEQLRRV